MEIRGPDLETAAGVEAKSRRVVPRQKKASRGARAGSTVDFHPRLGGWFRRFSMTAQPLAETSMPSSSSELSMPFLKMRYPAAWKISLMRRATTLSSPASFMKTVS